MEQPVCDASGIRITIKHVIDNSHLVPSVIVKMISSCNDLSAEKCGFLKVYLDYQELLGFYSETSDKKSDEICTVAPRSARFFRKADGTLVTRDEYHDVTFMQRIYVETGLTFEQQTRSSSWVYTKYGYVHSTKPPKPKTRDEVFELLGDEFRAMYEAKPVTRVPVGTLLSDILSGKVQCCELPETNDKMHTHRLYHPPPPLSDLFTQKRSAQLEKLYKDLNLPENEFNLSTWVSATNTVYAVMHALRLRVEDGRVVTDRTRPAQIQNTFIIKKKRKQPATKRVVWCNRGADDRAFLPETLRSNQKYKNATDLMGIICGRLLNMNVAALKAEAILISKIGVFTNLIKNMPIESIDVDTAIFCCIVASTMCISDKFMNTSPRKCKTLDKFMLTWYYDVLCKSPTTQWNLVASIFPIDRVLVRCNTMDLTSVLAQWMQVVTALRVPMQSMWSSAVHDATLRNMSTPCGFDVSGWNVMTRTWNIARYEIAQICGILKMPMPWAITKCIEVVTDAEYNENDTDPDCMVFIKLAKWGKTPWSAMDDPSLSIKARMEEIDKICKFKKIVHAYKVRGIHDPIAMWQIDGC